MADETTSTDAHGGDAAHGAAEAVGMPQLDFASFPNQIFWLVITLVVVYLILTQVALPRIAAVLAERQGTITNHIAAAEELKLKAEEAEAAYDKALADARSEANQIIAATRADIDKDLAAALETADAEISAKAAESEKAIATIRQGALAAVKDVASATAGDIVSALGSKASAADIKAAVEARMKG